MKEHQKRIIELAENIFIHENKKSYDRKDSYGGYGGRAGNYTENDNANANPIGDIIKSVLNNEISYQNFFEYVKNNFNSFSVSQKMQILEGVLHAIDDDDEFEKIKGLTD